MNDLAIQARGHGVLARIFSRMTFVVDRVATARIQAADPIDHPGQFMTCPIHSGELPDVELMD